MAVELPYHPRDNSLEALRIAVEEKKQEVKNKFLELKKLLQLSEDTATEKLDKTYTDIRDTLMKHQTNLAQLEEAKNIMRTTLADNNVLQTALQGIDAQIAEARNSFSAVPKHILLRWRNEDVRQCFENMCEVISSKTADLPAPILQPNNVIAELESLQPKPAAEMEELLMREEKYKQTISKLEVRQAENEREMDYKNENVQNLEKELKVYSQMTQAMSDKYNKQATNSKFWEAEEVRQVREERTKLKNDISVLNAKLEDQRKKHNSQLDECKKEIQALKQQLKADKEARIRIEARSDSKLC